MKVSFALNSKSNPKPRFNLGEEKSDDTRRIYVTEFDSTKPIDDKPTKIIIPPLENKWKTRNMIKYFGTLDQFEAAPTATEVGDQGFNYGLTLMKLKFSDMAVNDDGVVTSSIENLMLKMYKEDMENLSEDRGFDEFVDCPVEGYGEALLAGYGWKKGQGIGKNAKEDVQVVQYVRRNGRQGLGYEAERRVLVAPKGRDGRIKASAPY